MSTGYYRFLLSGIVLITVAVGGCVREIGREETTRFLDRSIHIVTTDSVTYGLASGWRMDSVGNCIRGFGYRTKNDSTSKFRGSIPYTEVRSMTVIDSETPAYYVGALGIGIGLFVWYQMEQSPDAVRSVDPR